MTLSSGEKGLLARVAVAFCIATLSSSGWRILWKGLGWLVLIVVAVLGVLMVIGTIQRRRKVAQYQHEFRAIFGDPSSGFPKLKVRMSYGYDSFTILLATREEVNQPDRQEQVARFKNVIQEMCKDQGTDERPFNVNRAVWVHHDGYLEEMQRRVLEQTHGSAKQ
jgi:hypothetical protein